MFSLSIGDVGETFIDIFDCRAQLARTRWEDGPPGEWRGRNEYALNSDDPEIQGQIMEAIRDAGAAINMSGRVPCPLELAALAIWRPEFEAQYGISPDATVIYASTVDGDSLPGTWGYSFSSVEEAVQILIRDFDYDDALARARVETMPALEAVERGLSGMFCKQI